MKFVKIALLAYGLAAPVLMGQSANVVNSSRSNIKNNISVSVGPDKKTHCMVSDKPCAKEDVEKLNAALAGKLGAPAKSAGALKSVVLAPDGSLTCVSNEGKQMACTASHVAELNGAVAAMPSSKGGIDGSGIFAPKPSGAPK